MIWIVCFLIATFINTLIITMIVDIAIMGSFTLKLSAKCSISQFVVGKDNEIAMQNGNECAGYATAFILRHYDIPADGEEIYQKMSGKMAGDYVNPKGIKKMLEAYGFSVKYCAGNLNALKREICKGNPVIVFIRVRKGEKWLHYVPVVGYDGDFIFLAESLPEFVNCTQKVYNRKISEKDFLALWNTSMLKMPLYTHTFYMVEKKQGSN